MPDFSASVFLRRDYNSRRNATQIFLKDTLKLSDAFELTAGFKGLSLDYAVNGYRDYNDYYRTVGRVGVAGWGPSSNRAHYQDLFLPLAGALYKLSPRSQIFASYAENLALPKGLDDFYAVTLSSSNGVVPQPQAEKSQNAEIGIRTRQREFFASLAGYYTQYANQIQSITTFLAGSSGATETYYTNVGRVKAYGLEFAGSYKSGFLKGLAYANLHATWNHARLRDNVIAVPTTYYTAGKALPDAGGAQSLPRNYGQIGPELPPARKLGLIDGAGDADLVRAHNTIDQVIDPERRVERETAVRWSDAYRAGGGGKSGNSIAAAAIGCDGISEARFIPQMHACLIFHINSPWQIGKQKAQAGGVPPLSLL